MKLKDRHLWMYCLAIWLNFVLVITFWKMLINSNPNILIETNNNGEFWFEFFLLNGTLILLSFFLIKQAIECFKDDRPKEDSLKKLKLIKIKKR